MRGEAEPVDGARAGVEGWWERACGRERVCRRGRVCRRDEILGAMVAVAAERGFERASVRLVAARAGVSTRTFYEEFDGLRDCFLAVLDLALECAGGLIAGAFAREQRWQDGVLGALASLLSFFDSEPALARVWFVEAMAAGGWALRRREEIAARLRAGMIEYWAARGERAPDPVVATGVMAAVLGLIQAQLVSERGEPLIELLGPSMGLVTAMYLDREDVKREVMRGEELAREIVHEREREIERGEALARKIVAERAGIQLPGGGVKSHPLGSAGAVPGAGPIGAGPGVGAGVAIPAALRDPRAYRMRLCLLYVAERGERGSYPSNREVAQGIGVSHPGQVSALLTRLARLGLLAKRAGEPGRPNAWRLTAEGELCAGGLRGEGVEPGWTRNSSKESVHM